MSQSLRESRSSPLPHPSSAHNDTNTLPSADLDLGATESSFNPALDEAPESTRHQGFDDTTQPITNMRSSAARFKYWQPPKPEQRIDTSQIQQEFHDFSDSNEVDESRSIEIGRGQNRSTRNTPNKLGEMSPNAFSIGNDSLYNLSEAARNNKPRVTPRKSDGAERVNLRRDAQLRRASSLPQKDLENIAARLGRNNSERVSPRKNAGRPSLAAIHAKLAAEEDSSFLERPPTATFTVKNPRFGNRVRQTSGAFDDTPAQTPQKSIYATPRSAAQPGTATHQSFMLPDLPNLTELVSGSYKDGTPVFSRDAKSRSRFSSAPIPSRLREETTEKHVPIESVPIPSEEKALYTSLQLLKDRLAQMEQDKAEAEKKFEDYEAQVADLRAELTARDEMRRSDSALGSTDGEGNKKDNWRVEKTRLQSQVESLRSRLERAERKNSVNEIATKRITEERDNAVTQLGVAFFNSEEIKTERDALLGENECLRKDIDAIQNERDELHDRLAQYEEHTQRMQKNSNRKDSAIRKENETLHTELKKAQAIQAEHAKLKSESDALRAQVAQIKAQRQEEVRSRNQREAELRTRIDRRDDTIQSLKGMSGEEANDNLRNEIEEMQVLLAELETQRDEDAQEWARKEARLRKKMEKSREAAKEAQDITKELLSVRRSSSQRRAPRDEPTETGTRAFDSRDRRVSSSRRRQESSLPRANSRTRPGAVRPERRSMSAPQPEVVDDADSETESTTDLDAFTHSRTAPPSMHGAVPGLASKVQEPTGDTTELSFMGRDEIARLRKMLEEERAAARKHSRTPSQTRQARDDTTHSVPRKSSMKDLTSASRPMDLTEANTGRILSANPSEPASPAKHDTQQSIRSQSNRRRRSAPTEMTSAFILPDITVDARSMPSKIQQHDDADCTVCRKASCSGEHTTPVDIPNPVPVSERMPDDVDATLRPSQPPPLALATVIKELQDELTHLNLQKAAYDSLLRSHDPALSKRKRKTVEAKIADLLQAISAKSDQIYALYDVVEGQKAAGQLNDVDEKEIEETLLSVGIDPEDMREKTQKKGKRVVIEEREKDSEIGGLTDDDDLPWEGISDTESLPEFNSSAGWKRRAVY
ncbi:hypothetical protein SLS56_007860 [Neofusicoccum ribis]|uniref:Cep57 centrosome microtubule-binding domain-containing protein n=1 Tax=Neofusicoccum ribis TaxID=45134 RepID=A0ABR3SLN9_9PEZI